MNYFISYSKALRSKMAAVFLSGFLLFMLPFSAAAQSIGWDPENMFFDETVIGTTATQTLTLTNLDAVGPLTVGSIEWTYNEPGEVTWTPSFVFVADGPVPAELLPGESMEIDITFRAESWSFKAANMLITNDSGNAPSLNYYVMGDGVEGDPCAPLTTCNGVCTDVSSDVNNCGSCDNVCNVPTNGTAVCEGGSCGFVCDEGYEPVGDGCQSIVVQTPVEMLESLVAFVGESVADGTLVGLGPKGTGDHKSAAHRLKLFTRMLDDALYKLTSEADEAATCAKLNFAQLRSDGGYPFRLPIDFIAGEATIEVYERIIAVMTALESCEIREALTRPVK